MTNQNILFELTFNITQIKAEVRLKKGAIIMISI